MSESVQIFLEIGIVGATLSFVIEFIKNKYGTESSTTKGLTLALAIVLGAGIYFLSGTAIWVSIVGVLAAASTIYAFFLK